MGLLKSFTDQFGHTSEYFKLLAKHENYGPQSGIVIIEIWKSYADSKAGKSAIGTLGIPLGASQQTENGIIKMFAFTDVKNKDQGELYTFLKTFTYRLDMAGYSVDIDMSTATDVFEDGQP